jgi:hypothetical protein
MHSYGTDGRHIITLPAKPTDTVRSAKAKLLEARSSAAKSGSSPLRMIPQFTFCTNLLFNDASLHDDTKLVDIPGFPLPSPSKADRPVTLWLTVDGPSPHAKAMAAIGLATLAVFVAHWVVLRNKPAGPSK